MFWHKKKEEPKQPEPKECQHKYKDFSWYYEYCKNSSTSDYEHEVEIYEPYVCIFCGNRVDKKLNTGFFRTRKDACQFVSKYEDHIKDRALVEDEINDTVLVDRDYLEAYEMVKGKLPDGDSMKSVRTAQPLIKLG